MGVETTKEAVGLPTIFSNMAALLEDPSVLEQCDAMMSPKEFGTELARIVRDIRRLTVMAGWDVFKGKALE